MKWLKILICSSLVFLLILCQKEVRSQYLSTRVGIYDFTDNVATEFYILAPGVFVDYDVITMSRLKFNTCIGFAFNAVKYNEHKHYLYFFPLFTSLIYDLTNPESTIKPYIGAGISFAGKADQNKAFNKTHYSVTYGYHAIGGINYKLKNGLFLQFDMRYNLLLNPVMEEVNMSGIVLTAGVKFNITKKEKNKKKQN